jgi:hypothetical protein
MRIQTSNPVIFTKSTGYSNAGGKGKAKFNALFAKAKTAVADTIKKKLAGGGGAAQEQYNAPPPEPTGMTTTTKVKIGGGILVALVAVYFIAKGGSGKK